MTKDEFLKHWSEHEAGLRKYAEHVWGKSEDDAHDVVQSAVCELLGGTRPYERWYIDPTGPHPETSLIALLREPVKNQCLRGWTKQSRRARISEKAKLPGVEVESLINKEEDEPEAGSIDISLAPDPDETDEQRDTRLDIKIAIDTLGPGDREIALLSFLKGMTDQEIADEKGWTHRKVECARKRILRLLKIQLEAYGAGRRFGRGMLKSQQAS